MGEIFLRTREIENIMEEMEQKWTEKGTTMIYDKCLISGDHRAEGLIYLALIELFYHQLWANHIPFNSERVIFLLAYIVQKKNPCEHPEEHIALRVVRSQGGSFTSIRHNARAAQKNEAGGA